LKTATFEEETEMANGKISGKEFTVEGGVYFVEKKARDCQPEGVDCWRMAPACESEASVTTTMAAVGSGN
jgi:hypothetical protein